jgi:hypothetical protein
MDPYHTLSQNDAVVPHDKIVVIPGNSPRLFVDWQKFSVVRNWGPSAAFEVG